MIRKIFLFTASLIVGLAIVFVFYEVVNFPKINIQIPTIGNIFKNSLFSLVNPPSESLVGNITSLSGDVEFQSRIATESAKIFSPDVIKQGEQLSTGVDGKATVRFDNKAEISLLPNTRINFAQTLPADMVLVQTSGVAEYKKLGDVPVSIRALHLLVESGSNTKITMDDAKPIITVVVFGGPVTAAYNDINNISKVLTVEKGKTLTFNDQTRRVVIETISKPH